MLSRVRYWFGTAVFFAICIGYCGLLPAQAGSPQERSATGTSRVATMRDLHEATTIPVTEYGAVGDCTVNGPTASCTDNASAIQSAIDHCFAAGCAVYFPANPEGKKATIYYVSHAINFKGVSLHGPAGAAGSNLSNTLPVAVRGAPGKDVFAIGDPTSSGYVTPNPKFAVRDLAVVVDNSVDASSSGTNSFPNRLPGRTTYDGSMTSGSSVLTTRSTYMQPGDVGQAVVVYGAGTQQCPQSGPTNCLITTVASWQSKTHVTLAAAATNTVSGAQTYVSVMYLSATQTIGNCAFSMDAASNNRVENAVGSTLSDFTNVYIRATSLSAANLFQNTCGFFFQGAAGTYQDLWEHDNVNSVTYGLAFVGANLVTTPIKACAGICDFNVVRDTWIESPYPWLSYGGSENKIEQVQLSDVAQGPNILIGLAYAGPPALWSIDIPEGEANFSSGHACATSPQWMAFRIAGYAHHINRLTSAYCSSGSVGIQWDASSSTLDDFTYDTLSPINIAGNWNIFKSSFAAMPNSLGASAWNVTGAGNTWETCQSSTGLTVGRCQYAGLYAPAVGPSLISRGAIAFNRTADFIDKGPSNYFLNKEDLWLWPTEVAAYASTLPAWTPDSTNIETGSSIVLPTGTTTNYTLWASNGTRWSFGSQVPTTYLRVWFYLKASGSQAFPLDVTYGTSGGAPTTSLSCNLTPTLTTTWKWYSCDVNASSVAVGSSFGLHIGGGSTNPIHAVWLGGFAIVPWNAAEISSSLQVGFGSTPMTSSGGNGTAVQHTTTATKLSGDLVAFDNNGNDVDSGIAASSLTGFNTKVPAWLQNLGTGTDGAENCDGSLSGGDYYYTTFNVSTGNTCILGAPGVVIHATGACTINGTITGYNPSIGVGGGAAGGSGGGTAAAAASSSTYFTTSNTGRLVSIAGTAGGTSGGNGGAAVAPTESSERAIFNSGVGSDGLYLGGSASGAGGSSGGAGAQGGAGLVLICGSITGTGTINLNGANGNNATANDTGASAGGGGGVFIASSQTAQRFRLTVTVAAGAAGSCGSYTGCGTPGSSAAGWYSEISSW
jgi:hypothetical protein